MAIKQLSGEVDCLELASIPAAYQRVLTASGGGLTRTICALLSGRARCAEILWSVDYAIGRAQKRLVIFLEDVDRNIRTDTFFNEVAALLGF